MNESDYLVGFLGSKTQRAYADRKARAADDEEAPKEKESSPNVALLKRVQRIIFSPSVSTLDQARNRLEGLIDEIDGDDEDAKKKAVKPVE
jgi:hypothetical protein